MARLSRLEPQLTPNNAGLLLFDPLHGYLHPTDPEKARFLEERKILANQQRLLAAARAVGMTTFYAQGAHAPDGSDTVARLTDTDMELQEGGGADRPIIPKFNRDLPEAQIAAELAPAPGDVVVPKHRWNAFYGTDLDLQLRVRMLGTLIIAGGSTDVGIAATMFAGRDMDYGLVVVRDACFSMRGNNNDFFMDRVFPRMGRVMTVDQVVASMSKS